MKPKNVKEKIKNNVNKKESKTKYSYKRILQAILLCIIVLIYIIAISFISFQNDTFFDIVLGDKYINEGITTLDDFSIHENLEYISHHFMVNIITYFIHLYTGFSGLYVLEIILASILAILFYVLNKKFLKNKKLSYAFVFVELAMMFGFISVRAQMYSYIFFLVELLCLENFLKMGKKRYLVILTLIPLFIINFHAGVIYFYYILIFVYLLNYIKVRFIKFEYEKTFIKRLKYLFIPTVLSIPLLFVNPFGIKCITYGIKTLSNSFINTYIAEFMQATLSSLNGNILFAALFIIIISYICTNKKIKIYHFLLLLGTTFMALMSNRHLSLFIICAVPCNLGYIENIIYKIRDKLYSGVIHKGKKVLKYSAYVMFFLTMWGFATYIFLNKSHEYFPKNNYPIEAVNYIKENIGNDKRIFNQYKYGSLLMYNDIKVFIDSRAELYTKEYNKDTNVAIDYKNAVECTENYDDILEKYQIDYLLLDNKSPIAKNISSNSKFTLVFEDKYSCIYVKK